MSFVEKFYQAQKSPQEWSRASLLTDFAIILAPLLLCGWIASVIYNLWFHPLRNYPGSIFTRATTIPRVWYMLTGRQNTWTTAHHLKYGDVVRVAPNELSYSSVDSWKDIYGNGSMLAGRKWRGLYDPRNPQTQSLQGEPNDKEHAVLRRIFSPAFSEKSLRDQEFLFKGCADAMVNRLRRFVKENPNKPVDIAAMYLFTTFDIMGDLAFNEPLGLIDRMEYLPFIKAQMEHMKSTAVVNGSAYWSALRPLVSAASWVFADILRKPLKFSIEHVNRRLANKTTEKPDIWSYVLKENKAERKLTLEEMHTNGVLFMLAGTETSATALGGLTYFLAVHPDKLRRATDEVRNAFTSLEDIKLQGLLQLPYLQACIEETLRMYPPVQIGLPRVTPPGGATISGQWVAPNVVVYTSPAANFVPWNFKNASEFIPERWISDEYESDKKSACQPFLTGPRNCLGKGLAYHEMRLLMASFLFSFNIELMPECKNWNVGKVYMINEKVPLLVKLTPVQS